jgi:hypothetical protein
MNPKWYGEDAKEISYPQVSTCITVTCIAGGKLVGCHLFYRNTKDKADTDLKTFGDLAKGQGPVGWVGVVGMFDSWKTSGKNWTTYLWDDADGGLLLKKVREVLGYVLGISVYDTSGKGEIDILAQKAVGFVSYSYKPSNDDGARVYIAHTSMDLKV